MKFAHERTDISFNNPLNKDISQWDVSNVTIKTNFAKNGKLLPEYWPEFKN